MAKVSPLMLAPPLIFGAFVALAAVGMLSDTGGAGGGVVACFTSAVSSASKTTKTTAIRTASDSAIQIQRLGRV